MPRAFLIHQKTKAKKAKADSSTDHSPEHEEDAMEVVREVDPVRGYEGDVEDNDRHTVCPPGYQFMWRPVKVSDKEITCLPGNPPAEKPPKPTHNPFPEQKVVCPQGDNRAGARQYVPSAGNNGYQLHSSIRPTKREAIHLSGVKVEPNENIETNSLKREPISLCYHDNTSITSTGSSSGIDDTANTLQSKYSRSTGTKRAYSNCYGILEPLNYSQQGLNNANTNSKRARYDVESSPIRQADTTSHQQQHRELDCEKGVMNKTLAMNPTKNNTNIVKGFTDVKQVLQTPLPAFTTCFPQNNDSENHEDVKVLTSRNVDKRDLHQPFLQTKLHNKPQKKQITRFTVEELTKSDVNVHTKEEQQQRLLQRVQQDSKQSRKSSSRPMLPHPYWSPLKIEVPQFEPSPLKMTNYVIDTSGGGHQFSRGGSRYQMSSSPVSSDMSPPSLPESPLNGAEEELARRLSESDRSDRSSTADQQVFHDQDTSSDEGRDSTTTPAHTPKGAQFWVKKTRKNNTSKNNNKKGQVDTTQHQHQLSHNNNNVATDLSSPMAKESKPTRPAGGLSSGGGLRLHDPYFWQNNIPNLPVDFTTPPKMSSPFPTAVSSPIDQMRDYPYLALPHYYMNYLSALEKGGAMLPFLHPIWRPPTQEAFHHHPHSPYLVNPALMDPRYMQYQAEMLKCESPLYKKNHLTPTTPLTYKDSSREKAVTINEHIYLNERPMSLESAASDKFSTISEDSTETTDTVKSSGKINNNNNNNIVNITPVGCKSTTAKHNCEWCGKSYSTFSGLAKHKQFHCSKQIVKHFNCQHCDKEYTSLGALKMHIRTHTLPCKCHICGKAFSRPWLLQGHIRTHTGEKPFSCQHCSRAFADRSNLRAHLQTHSDVKKYSCELCQKTFSRMSLLIKHKESGCSVLTVV